jgi:murein DD-endopeptidase MepM/ murein hydrolase activator NlpD
MSSSKRRCQPTSILQSNAAAGSKLGFAAVCVVFAAGCSADVSRFDLGNPSVASGYAPSDSGGSGSSNGSYGRDPSYGSTGSNRNSTAGYTAPRSYGDNTVARQELDVPRETSALPPPTNQTGTYEGGRYDSAHYRPTNQVQGNQYQGAAPVTAREQPPAYAPQQNAGYAAPVNGGGTNMTASHGSGDAIEVQQGDTLYSLSRRHQVSVSDLMSTNQLTSPAIKPGQKLYLPGSASAKAAPRAPAPSYETAAAAPAEQPAPAPLAEAAEAPANWNGSHTVKPGESLYAIARENKIKLAELERYNGIADSRKVMPGTVLKVPGYGSSNGSSDTVASNADTPRPSSAPATIPVRTQSMSEASSPPPTASSVAPAMLNGNGSPPPSDNRVARLETPGTMSDAGSSMPSQGEGSVAGSKLRWPVAGKVVSTFGPRPDGTHNDGVNVAAPLGTDVHAAESGVVAYAGDELKGYGNLVLIRHDNGWVTAYAHADEIMVKRGDRIKRGQVIAKAGRTGQVDQPQVHFELRQGQKPVDPTPFMERM